MRRREFLALAGGAVATYPMAARGQQRDLPVIGFLNGQSAAAWAPYVAGFRRGLGETGYVEGQTVSIEYRWAEGRYDRLPELAHELVARRVQVLVVTSGGSGGVLAAKNATSTIPIIFSAGIDPVKAGLVASLARPGGNITGVAVLTSQLGGKRVQFLHELLPNARGFALLHFSGGRPRSPSLERRGVEGSDGDAPGG